jgi:C4-dicarboxylate-specific signal transduction histidine kinase
MVIFSRTFYTVQSSRAGAHALLHVVPVAGSRLVLLCCFAAVQLLQGKLTASMHFLTCSLLLTETRRFSTMEKEEVLERTNKRTNERTNEQTNERTNEQTNEQTNERTNKQTNKRKK